MQLNNKILPALILSVSLLIPISLNISNVNSFVNIENPYKKDKQTTPRKQIKVFKSLNSYQKDLIAYAKKLNILNGFPPGTMQGIILQESNAGGHFENKDKIEYQRNAMFFGVMQVSLMAAQDVLNRWPHLKEQFNVSSKHDIKEQLILNDTFNLIIAGKYLIILKSYGFSTLKELALAYNRGPNAAKKYDPETHPYATSVANHAQKFK